MAKEKNENIDIEQEDMYNSDDIEVLDEELESSFELKLKKLREKLKECENTKGEYLDGWQRSKAEFLNSKKTHAEALGAATVRGEVKIIEEILPILDSFDLAFGTVPDDVDLEHSWIQGIINIQSQLLSVLEGCGIKQLDPVGESFDPTKHESIGVVEVDEKKKDNTIAEVFQKGYEHRGMLIRPPKVRVAQYNS